MAEPMSDEAIADHPDRKSVVRPGGPEAELAPTAKLADPAMVKALTRAFRWQRMPSEGRYGSISEIAAAEKIDRGYVGSILRLTLLAPTLLEVIINGGQPSELALSTLVKAFPTHSLGLINARLCSVKPRSRVIPLQLIS